MKSRSSMTPLSAEQRAILTSMLRSIAYEQRPDFVRFIIQRIARLDIAAAISRLVVQLPAPCSLT